MQKIDKCDSLVKTLVVNSRVDYYSAEVAHLKRVLGMAGGRRNGVAGSGRGELCEEKEFSGSGEREVEQVESVSSYSPNLTLPPSSDRVLQHRILRGIEDDDPQTTNPNYILASSINIVDLMNKA